MENITQLGNMSILGEKLFDLCDQANKICSFQDAVTHKYCSVSKLFADSLNASKEKLVGNTLRTLTFDMFKFNTPLNELHIQQVEALNQQMVIQKRRIIVPQTSFTSHFGIIQTKRLTKIPIINSKKKLVAIVTYVNDLTKYYDVLSLFNLYYSHYPRKKAILIFLKHLSLDQYFDQLPTHEEILALLALYFEKIYYKKIPSLERYIKNPKLYTTQLSNKVVISIEDILYLINTYSKQ